jgi:hypothetical protein
MRREDLLAERLDLGHARSKPHLPDMQVLDPMKLAAIARELANVKQTHMRLLGLMSELMGTNGDPAAYRLVRECEFWSIACDGRVTRVRHCKGLDQLARLIRRPHVEIAAVELAGALAEQDGPAIDRRARAAYASRLAELRDRDDPLSRGEAEAIARELARAVGLGGRLRARGAAERARINVTRTLKAAIARIAHGDRELGRHLATSVRTGAFCCYNPHVLRTWLVR